MAEIVAFYLSALSMFQRFPQSLVNSLSVTFSN